MPTRGTAPRGTWAGRSTTLLQKIEWGKCCKIRLLASVITVRSSELDKSPLTIALVNTALHFAIHNVKSVLDFMACFRRIDFRPHRGCHGVVLSNITIGVSEHFHTRRLRNAPFTVELTFLHTKDGEKSGHLKRARGVHCV